MGGSPTFFCTCKSPNYLAGTSRNISISVCMQCGDIDVMLPPVPSLTSHTFWGVEVVCQLRDGFMPSQEQSFGARMLI